MWDGRNHIGLGIQWPGFKRLPTHEPAQLPCFQASVFHIFKLRGLKGNSCFQMLSFLAALLRVPSASLPLCPKWVTSAKWPLWGAQMGLDFLHSCNFSFLSDLHPHSSCFVRARSNFIFIGTLVLPLQIQNNPVRSPLRTWLGPQTLPLHNSVLHHTLQIQLSLSNFALSSLRTRDPAIHRYLLKNDIVKW